MQTPQLIAETATELQDRIGTRVRYTDMANPPMTGTVIGVLITRYGVQYQIRWDNAVVGETFSDMKQGGWSKVEPEPKANDGGLAGRHPGR